MIFKKLPFIFNLIFVIFTLLFLQSCDRDLSPLDYVAYIENPENGLVKEYVNSSNKLTCCYTPSEYVILKQTRPENLEKEDFLSEVNEINNMYHFTLKFEKNDQTNFLKDNYTTSEQFQLKSTYLSFDMRHDLVLVEGKDTLPCVLNHHERTYSNTPFEKVHISFPKLSENQDLVLIFDDRVFGFYKVKFHFSNEDLHKTPEIKF